MRVRWWLVFLVGGLLLGLFGILVLGGTAQFVAACLGVAFIVLAAYRRAGGTDYHRERPVPPGSGGPPG
jgi:hypothetical protein